ncbi:HsdM family class I SAM-dependent methyltransferase [Spirosoma areae]
MLTSLVNYLDAVDLSNRNASADVLGDAYEYLIKRFADENKGGTTAGQFYTPQEVVDIIVRYLKPQKGQTAYDPTCGSGGFLIDAAKYARQNYGSAKEVRFFGQEDVWNTWAIANINMMLHGLDAQIKKGDTLKDPKFCEDDNTLTIRRFDMVTANFPFSQEDWWKNGDVKKDKKGASVTKKDGSPQKIYPGKEDFTDPYERFVYGTPPFSNGDFAFLQHIVASMNDTGRAGVVCPQGVLFRGQPEKTEEEDGQNRKADDEYLIRRGLLQGPADVDGNFTQGINIIDAIVILPGNLFYGTTIPGAILFFNKAKPADRRDKVLMVYAAKEGWYREEANMNTLLPHDVLRISTLLESWGDLDVATDWITSQKGRLRGLIQEELAFKTGEIELKFADDIGAAESRLQSALEKLELKERARQNPTAAELKTALTARTALDKLTNARDAQLRAAREQADKERRAIADVEQELLTMLPNPDLRKRYFAVVSMDELEENEFNLNIPRYVDTFEPEEEIDLKTAIAEFKDLINREDSASEELDRLFELI